MKVEVTENNILYKTLVYLLSGKSATYLSTVNKKKKCAGYTQLFMLFQHFHIFNVLHTISLLKLQYTVTITHRFLRTKVSQGVNENTVHVMRAKVYLIVPWVHYCIFAVNKYKVEFLCF